VTLMKWKMLPSVPTEHLSRYSPSVPPLLAQLLYNRGITDPADSEVFLAADKRLENDPFILPGIREAVARIKHAVQDGETIAVFGDFDADGVTSSAVLVQGIKQIGGKAIPYIPHRVDEGHGLNMPALHKLKAQGVTLVITVDCGITANSEAKQVKGMGMDLIINDHHEVVGEVPEALVVIDPKIDNSPYPFRELAGVGVAFKLLQALFQEHGIGDQADTFLDLVALGTVADMVPLVGENRYLVNRGLQILNETNRPGITAMLDCSGRATGQIDADTISFALAPRLNAAGRLDHASISYDLLMTDSPKEARDLANRLEMRNAERQRLTSQFMMMAEDKLSPIDPDIPLMMVADEGFHAGVNGVVAGKLTDKYYRPAIIVEMGEKEGNGSARSIAEFNLVKALTECSELLTQYGGHARAAGFMTPRENIDTLHQRLLAIAKRELTGMDLQPNINIGAEIPISSMSDETFKLIKMLEPCGQANTAPTFLSRGVRVVQSRQVGSDGEHLKLKLGDRGVLWDAIGFGLNHLNGDNAPLIDIVYNLKLNRWRGQESLQLELLDFTPSI
jgi:single-stranded-DNA-specific exonuclease